MKNTRMEPSFFDQIKSGNFSNIIQTARESRVDWSMAAIFLGCGFLSSFLFKRYYKMVVTSLAVSFVLIWVLDHFFHVIDWNAVNTLVGDSPMTKVDSFIDFISVWISQNIILAVSAVVGFLLGFFV